MENGSVLLGNTEMDYVSFGEGEKRLVVLPGLSDGLTTVKGKAWLLSLPYRKFFRDYTVYMFSRKNGIIPSICSAERTTCRKDTRWKIWPMIRLRP